MLVVVILERLGEAHCGQPCFVKRIVVPAAAVAVLAENQANRVAAVDFFDGAGEFARGRITIIDLAIPRKQAHAMRPSRCRIGPHDVVVKHPAHGVALLLDPVDKMRAAEQSLLLAGNCREENRCAITAAFRARFAQQARTFHAHRRS